jgi:hypothetical protein
MAYPVPVTVEWHELRMSGSSLMREAARVVSPVETADFATVRPTDSGLWLLRICPSGPSGPAHFLDFASREKVVRHVERWAAHHWRRLPLYASGLCHNPAAR